MNLLQNTFGEAYRKLDYHTFGSLMPGRNYSSSEYRYGFNGKENDNEVYSVTGASQDYGFRIYNNRLGRFLSVDPLTKQYPELTPYQFSSNNPIKFIDIDGLEGGTPIFGDGLGGGTHEGGTASNHTKTEEYIYNQGIVKRNIANAGSGKLYGVNPPTNYKEYQKNQAADEAIGEAIKPAVDFYHNAFGAGLVNDDASTTEKVNDIVVGFASAKAASLFSGMKNFKGKKPEKGNLSNPFKNSTIDEVSVAFDKHVKSGKLEVKFENPKTGAKSFLNKKSGYSYNIDPGYFKGEKVESSHIDVNYPNPKPKGAEKKKLPIKEN